MAEPSESGEEPPEKRSKLPILIGFVLMLALGSGGFFAVYRGFVLAPHSENHEAEAEPQALPDVAFVPIEPLVISLGPGAGGRHLRFSAQLEVDRPDAQDVGLVMPRVLDVLNGYLRAVEIEALEDPTSLVRLRSQMLRRVQIVTGEGRVRDLLVTEFVIN
jgi:flagellar protein FliL